MVELDKQHLDDAEKRKEGISPEEFYKKEDKPKKEQGAN